MVPENPYGEQYAKERGTPHSHWATYDMNNEGCRMNKLNELVSTAPFDMTEASKVVNELVALAHSKGYGEEDNFISGQSRHVDGKDEENDAYNQALVDQHSDDPDSLYTNYLDKSIGKLNKSALLNPDSRAGQVVLRMQNEMTQARIDGRLSRQKVEEPAEAKPTPKTKPASPAP